MKRNYYFYVLKNPNTKEIKYFGKSTRPSKRLKEHIYEAKKGRSPKCIWIRSLVKPPILEIVYEEVCTNKESSLIEKTILRKLMKKFNLTNSWDNCVGAYKTGKLVYQYSPEGVFIRVFENANHASIVTGIPDSNILRSCKKSNEKGVNYAGGFLWLHDKHKKYPYNIFVRKRGTKPVDMFTKEGEFLRSYTSAREANKDTGIHYKLISSVCTGDKKHTHGYIFKFKTK